MRPYPTSFEGADGLLAHREPLHQFRAHLVTPAGRIRNGDLARRGNRDLRLDDVLGQ